MASTPRGRHRRSPRSRFSCARAMPRPRPRRFEALSGEAKSSGEAQLLLGRLLLRKEDWNGAKAALDSAAAALPGLAEAQAALGTAAYNVGELKLAAEAYGRAAALEPDNVAYLSNHGLFLGYDGRLDEGLAVLLKVAARPDAQGGRGDLHQSRLALPESPPSEGGGERGRLREGAEARSQERQGRARRAARLPRGRPVGARDHRLRARVGGVPQAQRASAGRHGLVLPPERRGLQGPLLRQRGRQGGGGRAQPARGAARSRQAGVRGLEVGGRDLRARAAAPGEAARASRPSPPSGSWRAAGRECPPLAAASATRTRRSRCASRSWTAWPGWVRPRGRR